MTNLGREGEFFSLLFSNLAETVLFGYYNAQLKLKKKQQQLFD